MRVAFAPVVRVAPPAPVLSVRHPSRLRSPAVAVLTAAHRLGTNTRGNYGNFLVYRDSGALYMIHSSLSIIHLLCVLTAFSR